VRGAVRNNPALIKEECHLADLELCAVREGVAHLDEAGEPILRPGGGRGRGERRD
jgi:hypothetical protein